MGSTASGAANCIVLPDGLSKSLSAPSAAFGMCEPLYRVDALGHKQVGDHIEFCLRVIHRAGKTWSVWRRFSQLAALHNTMQASCINLPVFPEKTWLPNSVAPFDEEFVCAREAALVHYLNEAICNPRVAAHWMMTEALGVSVPGLPSDICLVGQVRSGGSYNLWLELEADPAGGPVDECRLTLVGDPKRLLDETLIPVFKVPLLVELRGVPFGVHPIRVSMKNCAGESEAYEFDLRAAAFEEDRSGGADVAAGGQLLGAMPPEGRVVDSVLVWPYEELGD
mmetsp:Transcript_58868/g.137526  ORF Transcript_58868/g.137526 Transcript_58868/m.137526 type:complete len:281 (+) Transcript_58868:58-900(+)